jgi:hypothetical protein
MVPAGLLAAVDRMRVWGFHSGHNAQALRPSLITTPFLYSKRSLLGVKAAGAAIEGAAPVS